MIGGTYDLGNAQINPGGSYQFSLRSIPVNCTVSWLNMGVNATVNASATHTYLSTFGPGTSNQMLGETLDDTDRVLSSIIFGLDLNVSPSFQTLANLSIPRLRTLLSYITGQDIQQPANGTSIATTGTLLSYTMQIPMDLSLLIPDFSLFKQGALRFASAGQVNVNYAAATAGNFTGSFVVAQTFTIATTAVQIRLQAKTQQVSNGPGYVGPLWDAKFTGGAQSTGLTKPGIHLGLFDQTGQTQNFGVTYAPTAYNVFNGANSTAQNASPGQQISNYQQERTQNVLSDMTARGYPMFWYNPNDTLADVDQSGSNITYQVTEAQSPTLYYLEIIAQPPNSTDLTDVATRVNGGGPVKVDRGVAKSMGGKRPSAAIAPLLPVLIYPASVALNLPTMNPSDVGNWVAAAIQTTVGVAKTVQSQGKQGHRIARGGR
jgi:hypothetical protein